jgi:hypothetical protein
MTYSPNGLLEADVTRQVKDFMQHRGWRALRMQRTVVPGAFQTGEPGIPDFLFLRYLQTEFGGLCCACWIELKRATRGKLSQQQKQWRDRERARGAVVLTASDIKEFHAEYYRLFGWLQSEEWVRGGQREIEFKEEKHA